MTHHGAGYRADDEFGDLLGNSICVPWEEQTMELSSYIYFESNDF